MDNFWMFTWHSKVNMWPKCSRRFVCLKGNYTLSFSVKINSINDVLCKVNS